MISVSELEIFKQSIQQATERLTGEALDAALAELGWPDALAADPRAAVSVLFELQGVANATSSALAHVIASGLGLEGDVVLPAFGHAAPPGEALGDRVVLRGLGLGAIRDTALIVARANDTHTVVTVDTADLTLRPVGGLDPALGLTEVTGEVALPRDHATVEWAAGVALGRLAIGHEIVGAARKMLALAREHALERIQFGKPISAFQAVRHRLADTLVAIESADAVLAAAWDDRSPQTATIAKALAGRGGRTAARHCQQVLAGIGFTTEHPFHRYLRRVLVLDQLLGDARSLTKEFGDELLGARELPALLPL